MVRSPRAMKSALRRRTGGGAQQSSALESIATGIVSIRFVSQSSLGLIFCSVPQRRSPSSRLLSNSDTE